MDKFVIYNSDDDTYLNCGHNIHLVNSQDNYVEDVNDATLFNTVDEIWEYLDDYDYGIVPVVIKVTIDVEPDHTIDYYAIKQKCDQELLERKQREVKNIVGKAEDAVSSGELTSEQLEVIEKFIKEQKNAEYQDSDTKRAVADAISSMTKKILDKSKSRPMAQQPQQSQPEKREEYDPNTSEFL